MESKQKKKSVSMVPCLHNSTKNATEAPSAKLHGISRTLIYYELKVWMSTSPEGQREGPEGIYILFPNTGRPPFLPNELEDFLASSVG